MTEQEINTIHELLSYMDQQRGASIYLFNDVPHLGFSEEDEEGEYLLRYLVEQNLVKADAKSHDLITLSTHGREIARSPGGYKGYLNTQRLAEEQRFLNEQEDRALARINTQSTQEAATSASGSLKWAKVSGIAAVIAILASILFFFIQRADSNAADDKIIELEQRIQALENA